MTVVTPRRVLASMAALAAFLLHATLAPTAGAQPVQDLRFNVQDLQFRVGDLEFDVRDLPRFDLTDLVFDLQPLDFRVEDITASIETEDEVRFRLAADVLFALDSDSLQPHAEGVLRQLAEQILGAFSDEPVRVEGHTDSRGSTEYNQGLSERRAESVKRWLAEHGGIAADRLTTVGHGERQPVEPNEHPDGSDNPVGRQANRRVEIVVERSG